jgi:hypothetical protein
VSSRIEAEWRETEREIVLDAFAIDAKHMGALRLALTVGGARPELFSANADIARLAALATTLKLADLTIEDGELIDRILTHEAKRSGESLVKPRADYARDAGAAVAALLGGDNGKAHAIGAAVTKFIERPKRLRIRLSSPKGVGALDGLLKKPGDILNEMEVEATAE